MVSSARLVVLLWMAATAAAFQGLPPAAKVGGRPRATEEDEDMEALFQARVDSLGGKSGVEINVMKNKAKRGAAQVGSSLQSAGTSVTKFLDLQGSSREPASGESVGGWGLTVGFLGLVVLLACLQAFRLDPANYT
mmetsp:Transcript_240/g.609  ORF Transcript_240/g.609 Transcript_240/m.609 type:complete len:136 (-) Transcript_240:44-451(-)